MTCEYKLKCLDRCSGGSRAKKGNMNEGGLAFKVIRVKLPDRRSHFAGTPQLDIRDRFTQ